MRTTDERPEGLEGISYRELRLLEEVDSNSHVSQRQLARRLGIGLGVANMLVRKLARHGYIRVTHLSWKQWAYVLTPAGMARKLFLTVAYVESFMQHYRQVRQMLREDLSNLALNKESWVAIVGTTELAELAYLVIREIGVNNIEVFERSPGRPSFLGMRVHELESIVPGRFAKVVIANSDDIDALSDELFALGVSDSQIITLLRPRERGTRHEREASS